MAKQLHDLPNHHRFTGSYSPPARESKQLGMCPCGCNEWVTDDYVYVVCEDEYFVDKLHFMKYHGAVEVG